MEHPCEAKEYLRAPWLRTHKRRASSPEFLTQATHGGTYLESLKFSLQDFQCLGWCLDGSHLECDEVSVKNPKLSFVGRLGTVESLSSCFVEPQANELSSVLWHFIMLLRYYHSLR